jgi:hypothetical protein
LWHDHEAGCGGDALALIAHLRGGTIAEAASWARRWLGEPEGHRDTPARRDGPKRPPERPREASSTMDLARAIWRESVPAEGTLAQTYLAARGLRLEPGAPLRFHPACPRGAERLPALVALMTCPETGAPSGTHRTYLAPDGRDRLRDERGKMMCGNAGLIRLSRDEDVTMGLAVAEGIETALAAMQHFGARPMWAATSAGMLARLPVLAGIESLSIYADPDGAGLDAAETCAARWAEAGREARILTPPSGDFAEVHLARERAA